MALAWWLIPCLPFPGLPHIYFLFTVRLWIFHVCCNENFRNSYLSFYWKKWFYIRYMALAWWLVPCLPFPGLPHIYFLFTVRLTNEWVGVFLARRSVQHLVLQWIILDSFFHMLTPLMPIPVTPFFLCDHYTIHTNLSHFSSFTIIQCNHLHLYHNTIPYLFI
jgi:hypothetical protein